LVSYLGDKVVPVPKHHAMKAYNGSGGKVQGKAILISLLDESEV